MVGCAFALVSVSASSLGMDDNAAVRLEHDDDDWQLACVDERLVVDANAYLGYLADRNYSPRTICAYGYNILAFSR